MTIKANQLEIPVTSADKTKLDSVQTGAQPNPAQVSGGEKTAGTVTSLRSFSPADVKDMAVTHGGGGGSGVSTIKEEGSNVGTSFTAINFVGAGVTAADGGGGVATVTIPGGGGGKSFENVYTNPSGGLLSVLTPVRSSSGTLAKVDPSVEGHVKSCFGVTKGNIPDSNSGVVVLKGLIENITTSIPVDSPVFLSKAFDLTSTVPDIGSGGFIAGDFVLYLGQILRNSSNPSQKDLKVDIQVRGQL